MGLLDDAIREHLELKRLRGADSGEVARLEQEALGPIRGTQPHPEDHDDDDLDVVDVPAALAEELADADVQAEDVADTRQETAELDMQMYMEDVDSEKVLDHERHADGIEGEGEAAADEGSEDVLEETPEFLQETPEHERLWFEQQPPRDFDFDK
jgi:hypothetical protein